MGLLNSIFSGIGKAVSWVSENVVSPVIRKAKEFAGKALDFLATEAEQTVKEVKEAWKAVKPWLVKAHLAAEAAATMIPHPQVRAAAAAVARVLKFVSTIDEHPWAKRIAAALEWVMDMARQARQRYQNKQEQEQAEAHKEALRKAREMAPEAAQHDIRVAQYLNNSMLLRTRIDDLLRRNTIRDVDHFLRLRAAQRLLKKAEKRISRLGTDIDNISDDDMFLVEISSNLLDKNPRLNDLDAARLEKIVQKYFKKPLIAFVFEEMVVAWFNDLEAARALQGKHETELAKKKVAVKRLEMHEKLGMLSEEDAVALKAARAEMKRLEAEVTEAREANSEFQILIQAAEGFLQVLEKSEAELESEDLSWLADCAITVGRIVIDCIQNKKRFSELEDDHLSLLNDFSNYFEAHSKKRADQLIKVAA